MVMGVIVSKRPDWEQKTRSTSRNYGNASGPDDLYLAQRGLRTMAVRMEGVIREMASTLLTGLKKDQKLNVYSIQG